MAELCVDCMRKECKEYGEPFIERGWIISDDDDLCETCGEMKPVIVRQKKLHFLYQMTARKPKKQP